jgi:PAS domain S-box-containing protein
VGGESPVGALGFTRRAERDWPDALVKRLQQVAQIFANALARKRADQALHESEERMRMSQQAARVGTFDWNIKTGVNVWTPELEAMHGLPPGGFAKTQPEWERLIHPDDRAAAMQKVEMAFQTGQPAAAEWRVIWPDGSVHWLVGRFQVFKDEAGAPLRLTGINIDITERKRAEGALRASEIKYRNVVEMTGTGYLIIDLQGRVLDANQEYVRISGHGELREIIGRSVIEWTTEKAKQQNAEAVAQCAKDGLIRNFVTEYTDGSGKPTFVEVNAKVEGEGKSARIVSLCRDITERKRVEEALQESEARFRNVANTVPVLIWMADTNMLCNFVNKGWLDFTGRTPEQELGTGWAEGIHPEDADRCLDVCTNSYDARKEFRMEYRLRRRDGAYGWVLDTGVPRFAHDGTFLGYIGSCVDITERREAENDAREVSGKLITAQEDERKRIARDLHDDLNQRLALLSVEMELFAREAGTDREAWLQHIEMIAGRVREMSTNVHKLSYQLHPAKLDQLGLVVAARTFCREVSLQSGIAVHFEQHGVPRDVGTDVALCLYRVIQEALQNSVRHNGGAAVQVSLTHAGEQIQLLITDEGKGFDVEHAIHKGGLGLVSMRERVRQVNGSIKFTSSPGKGTRIEVNVPLLHQVPAV